MSKARIVSGYLVLASIIWSVSQWDLGPVLDAIPNVLTALVVIPAGIFLFLFTILSIPNKTRGR